jgi:hypothetical protein
VDDLKERSLAEALARPILERVDNEGKLIVGKSVRSVLLKLLADTSGSERETRSMEAI